MTGHAEPGDLAANVETGRRIITSGCYVPYITGENQLTLGAAMDSFIDEQFEAGGISNSLVEYAKQNVKRNIDLVCNKTSGRMDACVALEQAIDELSRHAFFPVSPSTLNGTIVMDSFLDCFQYFLARFHDFEELAGDLREIVETCLLRLFTFGVAMISLLGKWKELSIFIGTHLSDRSVQFVPIIRERHQRVISWLQKLENAPSSTVRLNKKDGIALAIRKIVEICPVDAECAPSYDPVEKCEIVEIGIDGDLPKNWLNPVIPRRTEEKQPTAMQAIVDEKANQGYVCNIHRLVVESHMEWGMISAGYNLTGNGQKRRRKHHIK